MYAVELKHLEKKYPNIVITGSNAENDTYCLVDSRVHGLYACFHCILYGLWICEEEGLQPIVRLGENHLYYDEDRGNNIFNYFYDQPVVDYDIIPKMTVLNLGGYLNWINISNQEKIFSNLLLKKYFRLNLEITKALADFKDQHLLNYRMLAVHYRGTDKITETPLLPFTDYLEKIDYLLDNNFYDRVYFATDELSLRSYVKHRYEERVVLYEIEGHSENIAHSPGIGLHLLPKSQPYLNARNAIMECYLLAQCHALMSSHKSSMSVFATFINPDLFHIILEP